MIDNVACEFGGEALQLIEDMKCCGNCDTIELCNYYPPNKRCKEWKFDGLTSKGRQV